MSARARRQIAQREDVDEEAVRVLDLHRRRGGVTARYIIDGRPGVHFTEVNGE